MKNAKEIRIITNSSQKKFNSEIARIEKEIIAAAHDGRSLIKVQVPAEIAAKIKDEFIIHGYEASNPPGSQDVEIKW
jgi:hypothetical protein